MATEFLGDADYLMGDSYLLGDGTDLLGADEIMGNDLALLGAAASRRPMTPQQARAFTLRAQQANMIAAARARQAGGLAVKQTPPTKGRVQVLGFDSVTNVVAGTTAPITKQPQILFRPRRLVIAAGVAAGFLIEDIKVGKDSQFVASGAVPASAFAPDSVAIDLKLDTCPTGASIVISVTNVSGADARFTAAMFGDSAE